MGTIHSLTRAPGAARSQATPVRFHALSIALDCVIIRLDNAAPGGWLYRRLKLQKRALEMLACTPGFMGVQS